jgi:type I restriction enzyme S subunit
MVPEGWQLSTLEKIATVSSGGTPSRKKPSYWNGNIPWVTTAEVQFKTIFDTAEKITVDGLNNSSAKLFPKNTILMAMYGQGKTRGQVAKLGIEATTNQACAAIILKTGYEIDYYYQFLISQYEHIREMSNSGGQKNLSAGIVKSIQVPVPPLFEQHKIAKILSTWDKAIATSEQLLANSQQQKKGLMQQLLTGEKRLEGFKQAWSRVKVSKMGSISSGGTPDTTKKEYWDGGINWLTPTDVTSLKSRYVFSTNKTISEKGLKNSSAKMLPRGALLICTRATIGAMAISKTEIATNQGFKNLIPNAEFSVEFLYYLFTFNVKELVRKSSGSTFLELSKSDFEKLTFLCPCLDEQHKIASVLIAADDAISVQQQKLHYLKQEKKALMQQLLTGKRRVKVEAA